MEENNTISSLRKSTIDSIGAFLFKENFRSCNISINGILELVNLISDYYEEGVHLYPEVIITNDLSSCIKTIPSTHIEIKEASLDVSSFKGAIKECAPLAVNGWIIYIEVLTNNVKYGLISAEMTETSLSLYSQIFEEQDEINNTTIAYVRNLGQKLVELVGLKTKLTVSLSLGDNKKTLNDEVHKLSCKIASKCDEEYKDKIKNFFDKIINEAIKRGHGNLIGVINDSEKDIQSLKKELTDGLYLKDPIDIGYYVKITEAEKTNHSSVALKLYSSLLISMLNHDGITVLTDKGRVLGYHLFVKNNQEDSTIVGGARTRAFETMKRIGFGVSFYRSQDGNIKYYSYE